MAVTLPAVAGLPVDQHLGNLEGKEMRFGTSAGATYAAVDDGRDRAAALNAEVGQPQPAGRPLAHDRHVAELRVRRQGRGHDQHAASTS